MSTTPPASRTLAQRWREFWFAPRDPTTLGFMRLMTGLLIIYIHLVYSLDLQALFGKYAWYGADYANRERAEFPWVIGSAVHWDDPLAIPRLPDYPHRRKAVLDFVTRVGELPRAERQHALRYLTRAINSPNPGDVLLAIEYARQLGPGDKQWRERREKLVKGGPPDNPANPDFPTFFRNDPVREPDRQVKVAEELDAFRAVLPQDKPGDTPDQRADNARDYGYILNHLWELDPGTRRALVDFILTLPENPAERAKLIDYLAYWNTDSRLTIYQGNGIFSVWFHVTDPTQVAVIHGMILVVMVLFTVGFCTRVTSVLTWMGAICYIQRSQQVLFGMDTMMNILLFYLMIGNSGAALSVDRLIARYRAVRASLRRTGTIDPATRAFLAAPPPSVSAGFAIRLVQIHFCFIYLAAGLSKLKGNGWWNGNAFWDVMANPEFTLLRYKWYEDMLRATTAIKPLYYFTITTGVWFTWFLEIGFPFLVWTRLRPVMVWLAILLHAGIGVLMGLNIFELLMMIMLLAFLPSAPIRDRLRGGGDLPRLGFGFNPADPKHARAAAVVMAADVDGQVALDTRKGGGAPALTAAGGKPLTGPEAVTAVFRNVRLLRMAGFVLWVPGVRGLLARLLFPAVESPPTPGVGAKPGPQTPAAAS